MTIIIFLVVLAVLIFIHELGHFLVAKKSGIRVDEFAIGFPPKIISWVRGETKYVLNLIPFGGYVKIFGENPDDESMTGTDSARSFVNAKKWKQAAVLLSGISFNILFAWILISISFMFGSIVPVGDGTDNGYDKYIKDSHVVLIGVIAKSPAEKAGLAQGDSLLKIISSGVTYGSESGQGLSSAIVKNAVEKSIDGKVQITYLHGGEIKQTTALAEVSASGSARVIGISMENVVVVKLNPVLALWEGGKLTIISIKQVVIGLATFIWQAVHGQANLNNVSGPVRLAGMVGDASHFGLAYFIGFIAFISLNLAVINLLPIPALDGGRVLFVIIEAIIRKPIKPIIANTLNGIGFILLIGLMIIISVREVWGLIANFF